jgi:hypothetical protein
MKDRRFPLGTYSDTILFVSSSESGKDVEGLMGVDVHVKNVAEVIQAMV